MNEPVSIIILNYNGKQFLKDCLESVLTQSYPEFEIIFFDNNSADGSAAYVRENFTGSRIKIVESKINLGFAGGNNEALKHCANDLIVLLNNDTTAEKDWLRFLVEAVSNKNTIASSFVITEGIPEKYYDTNGSVSYLMYNIMNVFENPEDEFYPNGCSLIFRKSETGEPFDSDYFYYGEDVYLGLRARFTGMRVKFVKESIVHHFGGGSSSVTLKNSFYT
jgi:GT2 family glycosyltransferase